MNSKEETILAVFIGLGIGLLVAFFAWNLYQQRNKTQIAVPLPQESSLPEKSILDLKISSPEKETLFNTPIATVSGQTQKGATVVISTFASDEVIEATKDGSFKTEVNLEEGQNNISISAFNADGQEANETRSIFYTKEKF